MALFLYMYEMGKRVGFMCVIRIYVLTKIYGYEKDFIINGCFCCIVFMQ